jgi:hypothetical protein
VRKHKRELIYDICEPEGGAHMGAGVPLYNISFCDLVHTVLPFVTLCMAHGAE